jgi:O-antigen/teichoic acid export membrane protein
MGISMMRRYIGVIIELLNPKGTGWYLSSYILSFGMNVLFTFVAASSLKAGGFGAFTIFTILTQIGVTIVNGGFYASTLTKANSDSSSIRIGALAKTRLTASMALYCLIALFAAAPICVIRPSLCPYVSMGMLYILLNALQPLWLYLLRGEHGLFNALQVGQRAVFTLPALIGMKLGLSLPWICLIFSISPLPTTIWFIQNNLAIKKVLKPRYWRRRRTLGTALATLRSESKFLFVDLIATLTASLPALIVTKTSGLSEVGGYSLAERFKSYMITLFSPLNSSQYHRLCSFYSKGLYVDASILLSRYQAVVWLITLGVSGVAIKVVKSGIITFAGGQYENARQAFLIFAMFMPFLAVNSGFNLLYFSTQRMTTPQQISNFCKILIFLIIYWPIHVRVGAITSAAVATVASELLATLLARQSSCKRSRLTLRFW